MSLLKEALEAMPRKPLNSYMRWRTRRITELKDIPAKNEIMRKEWKKLSKADLEKLKEEVEEERLEYEEKMIKWRHKYGIYED